MNTEILLTRENNIATVTINRPAAYNAISLAVLNGLEKFCDQARHDFELSAVIITGSGEKSFAAGADIKEMQDLNASQAEAHSRRGQEVFGLLSQLPVPVIAAVNGVALGGGLELALACDFIYASENALLGLVETSLGLIPGFGGVARLSRQVGSAWAAELIFSAQKIDAHTALRIGLVNQIFPTGEVVAGALKTAKMISERGPFAVAAVKRLMYEGQDLNEAEAHRLEQLSFGKVFEHDNRHEGIEAFLTKKKAQFSVR